MKRATGPTIAALCALVLIMTGIAPTRSFAEKLLTLPDGSKVDLEQKCPVCGMVIGGTDGQAVTLSYQNGRMSRFEGVAATVFKDGKVVGFDGARCLFVYNSIPSKYGVDITDMKQQFVTDFVTKKMFPVEKAFLVLGSTVKGRMGYEMIPFTDRQQARHFANTYNGKWVIQLYSVARKHLEKKGAPASKKSEAHWMRELADKVVLYGINAVARSRRMWWAKRTA
jgi:nitrous oxide reductase accessory protein NosL